MERGHFKKLKIVSGGHREDTFLLDEDGNTIDNVAKIEWSIDAYSRDGCAEAVITLNEIGVDLVVVRAKKKWRGVGCHGR